MQIQKLNCEPLIKSVRKIGIRILNTELFASGYLRDTVNILRCLTIINGFIKIMVVHTC